MSNQARPEALHCVAFIHAASGLRITVTTLTPAWDTLKQPELWSTIQCLDLLVTVSWILASLEARDSSQGHTTKMPSALSLLTIPVSSGRKEGPSAVSHQGVLSFCRKDDPTGWRPCGCKPEPRGRAAGGEDDGEAGEDHPGAGPDGAGLCQRPGAVRAGGGAAPEKQTGTRTPEALCSGFLLPVSQRGPPTPSPRWGAQTPRPPGRPETAF